MKYQVILSDPPWKYRNKNTGGSMKSGASAKYPTMTTDEICALKSRIPADKNSVLFLWATAPFLEDGLRVMKEWGYKYKTIITWKKVLSLGMGFWWRGQCEFLLFGVKGKVKAFRMQEKNIIEAKVGRHSQKPKEFRELIERATIHMPNKLELFAREQSEGWSVWGNEVDGIEL